MNKDKPRTQRLLSQLEMQFEVHSDRGLRSHIHRSGQTFERREGGASMQNVDSFTHLRSKVENHEGGH